jgi:ketosteroid isomerase-like protein
MSDASVMTVREFLDAARRGDHEAALASIHPHVEWHPPPDIPNAKVCRGRDEYVANWRDWLDAWDSYRFTPDEIRDGPGGTVVVSGVETARGKGSGIDVLSRRVTGVYEVRDRKIARFKAYLDRNEAFKAAGVRA